MSASGLEEQIRIAGTESMNPSMLPDRTIFDRRMPWLCIHNRLFWRAALCICFAVSSGIQAQQTLFLTTNGVGPEPQLQSTSESIWENGIGEGFLSSVQTISLGAGGSYGVEILGGSQSHHLALASLTYGHFLGHLAGRDHWYQGNVELRVELFGGHQFSPTSEWLLGLTPHLRYHFATGTRWIPFVDLGAGVSATSIGPPDLGGTFEFNIQAASGVEWFLKDNLALSLQAGYLHVSSANIHNPNLGVNGVTGMLGLIYFF